MSRRPKVIYVTTLIVSEKMTMMAIISRGGCTWFSDPLATYCVPTSNKITFEIAGPYISNVRKSIKKLSVRCNKSCLWRPNK